MFSVLKNHPFAVEAFFDHSIVLTFAFPKRELERLIPECLTLDTYHDEWGFIAMAIVQTRNLRPMGFPLMAGNDFTLIGYRVFVRYNSSTGKRLRGLYILKSETDKKIMEILGNLFTKYQYTTTDIEQQWQNKQVTISSKQSNFILNIQTEDPGIQLPNGSPFADWKEARRFAGPLPFTFTYDARSQKVLIIEGIRESWIPVPVKVNSFQIPFINTIGSGKGVLANAFIINNIPYYWKKGRIEQWKQ